MSNVQRKVLHGYYEEKGNRKNDGIWQCDISRTLFWYLNFSISTLQLEA
jgi:hypothetical protein